jgi:hypothetical protein
LIRRAISSCRHDALAAPGLSAAQAASVGDVPTLIVHVTGRSCPAADGPAEHAARRELNNGLEDAAEIPTHRPRASWWRLRATQARYLLTHRDGARYEVASANVNDVVGLVARNDLPVLVLNSIDGSLTRTSSLEAQVSRGRVRFYFGAPHACHSGRYCPGNQIWAHAHSIPVPGQPGLRSFTPIDAKRLASGWQPRLRWTGLASSIRPQAQIRKARNPVEQTTHRSPRWPRRAARHG